MEVNHALVVDQNVILSTPIVIFWDFVFSSPFLHSLSDELNRPMRMRLKVWEIERVELVPCEENVDTFVHIYEEWFLLYYQKITYMLEGGANAV